MTSRRTLPIWLALVLAAGSACGAVSARAEAQDEWRRSYPVTAGASFEIRNTNGRIRVQAGGKDTIDVIAIRRVKAPTEAQAKATLADFEIEEKKTGSHIRLESRNQAFSFMVNRSKQVDYTVTAPSWVNLRLDSTNGEIEVVGAGGQLHAESTNGDIKATALEGAATVETTNGDVHLEFVKLAEGGLRSSTTNGDITVGLPRDVRASFSARVTNGTISTTDLSVTTAEQSRRRLEGTIGGGGPQVRLSTTNGEIRVRGLAPVR
jgi:DUF4097 and DUF4098 domain-containing protein YvlB